MNASWVFRGGVREPGDGFVLLVHGAEEDRRDLDVLSRALAARGLRVLSFDLRGHGETTRGGEEVDPRTFTSDDWREMEHDLDAAERFGKKRWGVRPTAIVGSDVGSSFALRHAVRNGTETLVMLSPNLNYRGILVQDDLRAFGGRVFVAASAMDGASAQTAEKLRDDMQGAREYAGRTQAGRAHGADLLAENRTLEMVVDFVAAG